MKVLYQGARRIWGKTGETEISRHPGWVEAQIRLT